MASSAARNITQASRAPGNARRAEACGNCQGSGEIWMLDRQAGAVRIGCDCGAGRPPDAGFDRLAMITCHGIAFGITLLAVILIL